MIYQKNLSTIELCCFIGDIIMLVTGWVLSGLRKAKHVNQSAIADACGKSISYISNWENGRIKIPPRYINTYALCLGMTKEKICDVIIEYEQIYEAYMQERAEKYPGKNFICNFNQKIRCRLYEDYYEEAFNPRTRRSRIEPKKTPIFYSRTR